MTKLAPNPALRKTFDAAARAEALALIRLGCSRRMAAAKVHCAHTTIGRAAARDPQFAAALIEAESRPDPEFRELVRTADRRAEELAPLRAFGSLEVVEILMALFVQSRPPVRRKDIIRFILRLQGILVREKQDAHQSCPNCQKHARLFDALKQLSDNILRQQTRCTKPAAQPRGGAYPAETVHQNLPFLSGSLVVSKRFLSGS